MSPHAVSPVNQRSLFAGHTAEERHLLALGTGHVVVYGTAWGTACRAPAGVWRWVRGDERHFLTEGGHVRYLLCKRKECDCKQEKKYTARCGAQGQKQTEQNDQTQRANCAEGCERTECLFQLI